MAAVTFKLLMSSIGGPRNADGVMSVLGLAEKFCTVCARCTSGRRCPTSVTATDVGSGGRGTFGGGTGGGLRSARRGLKRAVAQNTQHRVRTTKEAGPKTSACLPHRTTRAPASRTSTHWPAWRRYVASFICTRHAGRADVCATTAGANAGSH